MVGRFYFDDFLHMPNWVYNTVEIKAPLEEVQAYLAIYDEGTPSRIRFNMHHLFPAIYGPEDLC